MILSKNIWHFLSWNNDHLWCSLLVSPICSICLLNSCLLLCTGVSLCELGSCRSPQKLQACVCSHGIVATDSFQLSFGCCKTNLYLLLEFITAGPFLWSLYPIVSLFLVISFYYGLQTNIQNKNIFPKTYD